MLNWLLVQSSTQTSSLIKNYRPLNSCARYMQQCRRHADQIPRLHLRIKTPFSFLYFWIHYFFFCWQFCIMSWGCSTSPPAGTELRTLYVLQYVPQWIFLQTLPQPFSIFPIIFHTKICSRSLEIAETFSPKAARWIHLFWSEWLKK